MRPFQCYILDDEPLAIKVIEQHLSRFDQFAVCGTSTDPVAAHTQLKQLRPDLLFLDIEMPEINGLELIASMQNPPEIIITTAYREYAVEGFERNVLDYLVKPIPFPRFMQAIGKFLDRRKPPVAPPMPIAPAPAHLLVKADRKTFRIPFDEILYVEGVKDYVKIVIPGQTILTKSSIGNFQKQLPIQDFLRIHKSFIVAKSKITAYTAHEVQIGKIEVPIGREYKERFFEEI